MCGIVGYWDGDVADATIAERMAARLRHRGPDDAGVWRDVENGIVLAHRRLSILDLSSAGHQPMQSPCGRYIIVFNGEIYNHLTLRRQLEERGLAPAWRGHADTETLLALIVAQGIERALQSLIGMFAIALWDRDTRTLTLARDRLGEKPLYYGWQQGTFLFGSELKSLKSHPAFAATLSRGAISLLLRYSCIPAPHSIYEGIHKLSPGHYLNVSFGATAKGTVPAEFPYWSYNEIVAEGLAMPYDGSPEEARDALESMLLESVDSQMLSDVPLGAFLSGGIDSSTIVALMQARSDQPVRTFTIGFGAEDYDEARQASAVAGHLGTSHTELYVSPSDALAVIPRLPSIYCEPFADASQIPTYLVSELASRYVKVALSGDAADELFGGYNRYVIGQTMWSRLQRLPRSARVVISKLLTSLSPAAWDGLATSVAKVVPHRHRLRTPGEKAHKLAGVLPAEDDASFYQKLISHWQEPEAVVSDAVALDTLLTRKHDWPKTDSFVHWMMAIDAQTYLPDDILVKVDRAAMSNSLETRVPYLDHRIVEFSWRIPQSMKIHNGESKWLLRQVLYKYVPRELVDRAKMGFSIPLHQWLRGSLRDWAEDLLDETRLRQQGYLSPEPIRQIWQAHLSGKSNEQYLLWDVLMFQAWLAEQ